MVGAFLLAPSLGLAEALFSPSRNCAIQNGLFWHSRNCSDQNGRGFDGLTGRSNILRREHDNQGVESFILSQISWKRVGGPGVVVEVLEGSCRPTERRIAPFRGKGGMLKSIGELQHE